MDSDDEDRRRDKFTRERDRDERRDNGMKRSAGRRDDYGSAKRSRGDDYDARDDGNTMLTFKKFLLTQDDEITDEDAVSKYSEYKITFKRTQLAKFFTAHKDEEWFRSKFHPDSIEKTEKAHHENVNKRLEVFNKLKEKGLIDQLSLDLDNAKDIIRIMDMLVVYLEGGSEDDIEALKKQKIEDESIEETDKSEEEKNGEAAVTEGEGGNRKLMQLHKTHSVFLRNIPPSVTQDEITEVCKRSVGFLRVALSEAIAERKFWRRGWATYRREMNIKEICWNLNAVKIRESEFNAIINRDITRRVRTTNGITAHKQVASNDLRIAAKLAAILDKRMGLFGSGEQPKEERLKDIRLGVDLIGQSKNALIREAKSVLMDADADEISPEEEELLHRSGTYTNGTVEEKSPFQRDEAILKALDMLILYLRIVHSIDFYGHLDYPNEDNMPSRCGILHVRGQGPSGNQWGTSEEGKVLISNKFVQDFTHGFNQRIEEALMDLSYVTEDDAAKLGKKNPDEEMEAFIVKNTVELSKDKWLCPLSGKKFKGPEFIRKHLMSKHEEAVQDSKKEAVFFNNYLFDPKRPVEPEAPKSSVSSAPPPRDDERRSDRYEDRNRSGPRYSSGNRDTYNRQSGGDRYYNDRRENRPQVSYRDLDAPEEIA